MANTNKTGLKRASIKEANKLAGDDATHERSPARLTRGTQVGLRVGKTFYGGAAFEHALANSVIVAVLVALGAFGAGLLTGVFNALYDYRGRQLLLSMALLPLFAP